MNRRQAETETPETKVKKAEAKALETKVTEQAVTPEIAVTAAVPLRKKTMTVT